MFRSFRKWAWQIRLLAGTKHIHTTIVLSFLDKTKIVFGLKGRPSVLYDVAQMDRHHDPPDTIFYLGEREIDLQELKDFIEAEYSGTAFGLYLWFFLLRWISWWKPVSCTTVVCDILRMSGLDIKRYVNPRNLYRKIKNADVSIGRSCKGWEDYNRKEDC
jgi:hypothetical protein